MAGAWSGFAPRGHGQGYARMGDQASPVTMTSEVLEASATLFHMPYNLYHARVVLHFLSIGGDGTGVLPVWFVLFK